MIPCTAAGQASLSFTISQSLLKLMSIELVIPSNHIVLCHPLLLMPSIFCSIRVFSNELALCIKWPKYWSFSFSIVLLTNIQGLFSFGLTGLVSLSGSIDYIKLEWESLQCFVVWEWHDGSPVIWWQIMNSQKQRRVLCFSFMKNKCSVFTDVPGITCLSAAYCSPNIKRQKPKAVQSTLWLKGGNLPFCPAS